MRSGKAVPELSEKITAIRKHSRETNGPHVSRRSQIDPEIRVKADGKKSREMVSAASHY